MSKFEGTLKHQDLGPGVWTLELDGGETLTLVGDIPTKLDGQKVTVQGKEVEAMGFGMVGGRTIEVTQVAAV
ncbi:MAG: hypothetical protein AAGA48_15400 [Myxococcota bacterium]